MLIVSRKLEHWLSQQQTGRLTIPSWAVFILNCPNLTQLQYFEQSHPRVGRDGDNNHVVTELLICSPLTLSWDSSL